MPVGKRKTELVPSMDAFADALLEQARGSESLADKISAGQLVCKWIATKNRLEDKGRGRGIIARCPQSEGTGSAYSPHQRTSADGGFTTWGKSELLSQGDNGGPALDTLKAKLPGFKGRAGKTPEE